MSDIHYSHPFSRVGFEWRNLFPHPINKDFTAATGQRAQTRGSELSEERFHGFVKHFLEMDKLTGTKAVDVETGEFLAHMMQKIQIPLLGQFGVMAPLHQDLRTAQRHGFFNFSIQFRKRDDVRVGVLFGPPKRAKLAVNIANIGIIDVAIHDVSDDFVAAVGHRLDFGEVPSSVRQGSKLFQRQGVEAFRIVGGDPFAVPNSLEQRFKSWLKNHADTLTRLLRRTSNADETGFCQRLPGYFLAFRCEWVRRRLPPRGFLNQSETEIERKLLMFYRLLKIVAGNKRFLKKGASALRITVRMKKLPNFWLVFRAAVLGAASALTQAQQLDPTFAGKYSVALVGPSPEGRSFVFRPGDPSTVATSSGGSGLAKKNYPVLRDPAGAIIGFGETGVTFATLTEGDPSYWVAFAPNGNLFYRGGFDDAVIGQVKPGVATADSVIHLGDLGLPPAFYSSYGQTAVVPAGLPGAGRVKFLTGDTWHGSTLVLQPNGTYTFGPFTSSTVVLDEGDSGQAIVFVPAGYPGIAKASVLISDSSNSSGYAIYAFELDASGDPVVATRRTFMKGVSDLCDVDPQTGDILIRAGDPDNVYAVRRSLVQGQGPVITIESPKEGDTVVVGAKIVFEGQAGQVGGSIARISLQQNGTEVDATRGPFGDNPHAFFLGSEALTLVGSYTFKVVAVGGDGLSSTSGPVHVSVVTKPNLPPTASLDLAGFPGQIFYQCQPIPVVAGAFDPDGGISSLFLLDGAQIITRLKTQGRFMVRDLPAGKHTLTLRAADNLGATATATLEVTVLAPAAGQVTGGFGYDGLYKICFSGAAGLNYAAEVSTNLTVSNGWTPVGAAQIGGGAPLVWSDLSSGTNTAPRFYRVHRP